MFKCQMCYFLYWFVVCIQWIMVAWCRKQEGRPSNTKYSFDILASLFLETGLLYLYCLRKVCQLKPEVVVMSTCCVCRLWSKHYGHWTGSCHWSSAEEKQSHSARHWSLWCITDALLLLFLIIIVYNPQSPVAVMVDLLIMHTRGGMARLSCT